MISFEVAITIALSGFCLYFINKMMVCRAYWVGFFGVVLIGIGIGLMIAVYPETAMIDSMFKICVGGACP